jgi:hypothetical protein
MYIDVVTDNRFENWSLWKSNGYSKDYYDDTEIDKFDRWVEDVELLITVCYKIEYLFGFDIVWKYDDDFDFESF